GDKPIGIRISSPTTDYVVVVEPTSIPEYEGMYTLQVGMKCEAFRDDPVYIRDKPWRISIEGDSIYYLNALSLVVHSYDTMNRNRKSRSTVGYSRQVSDAWKCR